MTDKLMAALEKLGWDLREYAGGGVLDHFARRLVALRTGIAELEAALAACQQDAARLDFIETHGLYISMPYNPIGASRAAIDAAIAAQEKT